MKINRFWLRIMGLSGMLGGLVLFAGDMLFYYDSASTNLNLNMGNATDRQIEASGVTALLGAWLYLLGLGQVYYAFKPTSAIVRNIVLACFAAILSSYGVVHGAYIAIATTAKLAVQYQLDMDTVTALASSVNNSIRLFVYPVFAVLSVVFMTQVWRNKTLYPRWILIFFPLVPFLFQGTVGSLLSGTTWVVIMGGYLNLMLVVFFLASTVALWKVK